MIRLMVNPSQSSCVTAVTILVSCATAVHVSEAKIYQEFQRLHMINVLATQLGAQLFVFRLFDIIETTL